MTSELQGHAVADDLGADPTMRRAPLVRSDPMAYNAPMRRDPQIRRAPNSAGLYDVLDLILDKGIVVDAFVRVSLVGIELLTIDARVVIASVDTYLRYAEGVERLQLNERSGAQSVPDIVGGKMKGDAVKDGARQLGQAITGDGEEDDEQGAQGKGVVPALAGGVRKMLTKGVGRIVGRLAGSEEHEQDDDQHQAGQRQRQQQQPGEREQEQNGRPQRQSGASGRDGGPRRKPQPGRPKTSARRR